MDTLFEFHTLFQELSKEKLNDGHFTEEILSKIAIPKVWNLYFLHISSFDSADKMSFMTMKIMIHRLRERIYGENVNMSIKFEFLREVLTNTSNSPELKHKFMELFCKYQKIYYIFTRLKMKHRRSKATQQISSDMYMNELEPNHKYTMKIYQNGALYLFSLNDLSKIFLAALTNTSGFMVWNPVPIKNPYTNVILNKAELYSIYFKMKSSNFSIHPFIQVLFRCNFNIYKFRKHNEDQVREYVIYNHVYTSNYPQLYSDVMEMIHIYAPNACIDPDFPAKELVDMMRQFLFSYYMILFTGSQSRKIYFTNELRIKIQRFFDKNPLVGRKMRFRIMENGVLKSRNRFFAEYELPSYENTHYFMKDHIYDETTFNRYIFRGEHCYMNTDSENNTPQNTDEAGSMSDNNLEPEYRETTEPSNNAASNNNDDNTGYDSDISVETGIYSEDEDDEEDDYYGYDGEYDEGIHDP